MGHDLIEVLVQRAELPGEEGYTTFVDLQEATGLGEDALRTRLKELKLSGRLAVKKLARYNIADVRCRIPAYKLVTPSE